MSLPLCVHVSIRCAVLSKDCTFSCVKLGCCVKSQSLDLLMPQDTSFPSLQTMSTVNHPSFLGVVKSQVWQAECNWPAAVSPPQFSYSSKIQLVLGVDSSCQAVQHSPVLFLWLAKKKAGRGEKHSLLCPTKNKAFNNSNPPWKIFEAALAWLPLHAGRIISDACLPMSTWNSKWSFHRRWINSPNGSGLK